MVQLSFSETTTYRWSFEEDVNHYAAADIQGIGVWRPKLSDFGEDKGIELLAESNLNVSSLLWAGGFTGSEGRSYQDSVADARDALRLAGAMRARCLVVYTGARAGHTHNHARRLTRNALQELLPLAQEFGVSLALEPMHPGCAADWTFLNSVDDTLELIETVDSNFVKIAFDTYHLGHDADILGRLEDVVPHIAVVHLGDSRHPPDGEQNRCRLGEGIVPLQQIVKTLVTAGYDGFYEVELMGEEIEASDYDELIEQSKRAIEEIVGRAGLKLTTLVER